MNSSPGNGGSVWSAERIRRCAAQWEAARAAGGDSHPDALRAQHRLAHAYRAARRFDDALRWFEAAATGSAARRGDSHWETLRYRSSLANCHYAAGHTDIAIAMFRELLAARRAALGANHPDTLRSRGSLANAFRAAGRDAEAAELRRRNVGAPEAETGTERRLAPAGAIRRARCRTADGGRAPGWPLSSRE